MPKAALTYKRIVLKLSGESLAGDQKTGISPAVLDHFAAELETLQNLGVQVAVVLGGGNIFRGLSEGAREMNRVSADHMGMLATVINSIALRDRLQRQGLPAQVMTATPMESFAYHYTPEKAVRFLEDKQVLLISGGTGNPFFTTDTAAVLRAVEIEADVILKGTRVDGVYNADPEQVEDAIKFDRLRYMEVIKKELKVMDLTAITLAMENEMPIIVFNFDKADNLKDAIQGKPIGTKVQG